MKTEGSAYNIYITKGQINSLNPDHVKTLIDKDENNPVFNKLAKEGGENFYNYIYWLGLAKDLNLIVLPSAHHYFYDSEDLKEVNTIVNLRQLNLIKKPSDFLETVCKIIPSSRYLIGCFSDKKNQTSFLQNSTFSPARNKGDKELIENGITSRFAFLNILYNFIDAKTYRFMTKDNVLLQLREAGFKVLDMTEINSLTYFCAQKINQSAK
jgi:hypothetical protein